MECSAMTYWSMSVAKPRSMYVRQRAGIQECGAERMERGPWKTGVVEQGAGGRRGCHEGSQSSESPFDGHSTLSEQLLCSVTLITPSCHCRCCRDGNAGPLQQHSMAPCNNTALYTTQSCGDLAVCIRDGHPSHHQSGPETATLALPLQSPFLFSCLMHVKCFWFRIGTLLVSPPPPRQLNLVTPNTRYLGKLSTRRGKP